MQFLSKPDTEKVSWLQPCVDTIIENNYNAINPRFLRFHVPINVKIRQDLWYEKNSKRKLPSYMSNRPFPYIIIHKKKTLLILYTNMNKKKNNNNKNTRKFL